MSQQLFSLKIQPQATGGPAIAYRIEEAAKALCLGRTTLYRLIREGKLKVIKVGKRTLISASELEAFLAEGGTNE